MKEQEKLVKHWADHRATQAIQGAEDIEIVSGEGTGEGTAEDYTGARTLRALKMAIRREQCEGDRWAYAVIDGVRYNLSDSGALQPRY